MNFKILFEVVTAIVALGGFWFGLWQYQAARKWKRLEFAASVMDKIKNDFDLRLAVSFLDWRQRNTLFPERYFLADVQDKSFCHTHKLMASAFDLKNRERLPETDDLDLKLDELTLERMVYVDTFDRFFQYLEDVNAFIDMGLVKSNDVSTLCYWANRLCDFKVEGKPVFVDYLKHYDYRGVFRLAAKFIPALKTHSI